MTAAPVAHSKSGSACKARQGQALTHTRLMQTADVNNPADRFLKTESLTFEGPWDAILVNPPDHIELEVGTGMQAPALPPVCLANIHSLYFHFCCRG